MIDWCEIEDGDGWELFARDFLEAIGFRVDIPVGRGPDRGRDLVVSERTQGALHSTTFRWLVSCKHFAKSNASVGVEEVDISDRCKRNACAGFMGFYSTIASSSLVDRLEELKRSGDLVATHIYDGRGIEAQIIARGMSKLSLRYIPRSFGKLRPIQQLLSEVVELQCAHCQRNLLEPSISTPRKAIIIFKMNMQHCEEIKVVCKGDCDQAISDRMHRHGAITSWMELSDLCNPLIYLNRIMAYMNNLHGGGRTFSDKAHETMKDTFIAVSQRTLREVTQEDVEDYQADQLTQGL